MTQRLFIIFHPVVLTLSYDSVLRAQCAAGSSDAAALRTQLDEARSELRAARDALTAMSGA